MGEFKPVSYRSFAEFFDREFLPGARPLVDPPNEMAAFAEARYFGWRRIFPQQEFPIKVSSLNAQQILGSAERAAPFIGGPVILGRLSPMDYHHVHYPDSGKTIETAMLTRAVRRLRRDLDELARQTRHQSQPGRRRASLFGFLAFWLLAS